MNIFNNDPNKDYNLVRGKYHSKVIAWDLITDGNMEKTRPLDLKIYGNHFWKEPGNKTSALVKLNKFQGNLVTIEGASYTVLQGKVDGKLKELEIHTEQMNKDYLEKVSEIAHQVYDNEKPSVKKMVLK